MYNNIMKIGVYTNIHKDTEGESTRALIEQLLLRKTEIFLSEDLKFLGYNVPYLNIDELAKASDILIVLGGDGTILRAAKECAIHNANILAVNLGYLGFLTEVENIKLDSVLDDVFEGKYYLEERSFLSISHLDNIYYALNEGVLERGAHAKLIKTEVSRGGTLVNRYSSDGIIVSTPTGSTAYSLSAGGPILSPDVEALIIVAICPHSLNSRPLVVKDNKEITIKLLNSSKLSHLNVDGKFVSYVQDGEQITIKKSHLKVRFIRLKEDNYYEKLKEKMSGWTNS